MKRLALVAIVVLVTGSVASSQTDPKQLVQDLKVISAAMLAEIQKLTTEQQNLDAKIAELEKALTPPCSYTVAPTSEQVAAAGGVPIFQVDTLDTCGWTVAAPDAWAVPSDTVGTGIGQLRVTVAPNTATTARQTQIDIAGTTVDIAQDAAPPPPSGVITTGAELTKALANKQADLKISGTLTGNFTVIAPAKLYCATPPAVSAGTRVTPALLKCSLVAADRFKPVVKVLSNNVTIEHIIMTGVAPDRTVVELGDARESDLQKLPDNVTMNQYAVLGDSSGLGHRGIEMNTRTVAITNGHVAGFLELGRQSQGVYSANGAGPFLIENNYIEASGENILFGGSDPAVPSLVPSDITVRRNDLYKPLSQYPASSVVNNFELKNARRVLVEDNVLDGSRVDVQTGQSVTLTPRNQYGKCTWCVVEDVTFRRNVMKNYEGYGAQILCSDNVNPSQRAKNIRFEHNLFLGRNGITFTNGMDGDFIFVNNTMPNITGAMISFNGPVPPTGVGSPCRPNLVWTKNVARSGRWGINSQFGGGQGHPSITAYTSTDVNDRTKVGGNVVEESNGTTQYWQRLPGGNRLLPLNGLPPLLDPQTYKYRPDPGLGW